MLSDLHAEDRTAARLELLSLGYTPLKLNGKAPRFKDWQKITVDEDLILSREWARDGLNTNTGIRCGDAGVIAIDIDVDDWTVSDAVHDMLNKGLPRVFYTAPLRRRGRNPRLLLVARTETRTPSTRTASYAQRAPYEAYMAELEAYEMTGDPQVDQPARSAIKDKHPYLTAGIDILSNHKQFAALGMHPGGSAYEWVKPLCRVEDLPVITPGEIDDLVTSFEYMMGEHPDWVEVSRGVRRAAGKILHKPDLKLDTVFLTETSGVMTVRELQRRPGFHDKCSLQGIEGRETSVQMGNGDIWVDDHRQVRVMDWPLELLHVLDPLEIEKHRDDAFARALAMARKEQD